MSENKHTPEPWYVVDAPWGDGTWINAGSPDPHHEGFVADCEDINGDVDRDTALINARRIVACVNACAGLDTDELERFGLGPALGSEIFKLCKQRDELLAALERTCTWTNCDDDYMPGTWDGSCGAKWTFTEDGPAENSMKFCPECGGKVAIASVKGGAA